MCFYFQQINQIIDIKYCEISIISSLGNGGAIYININLSLNIQETTFYQCISISGDGGAIYFLNGLDIKLYKICALLCKSKDGYYYQFSYLRTQNNKNNSLKLNTISKCFNESSGYRTI